jgi:hypothetical protein
MECIHWPTDHDRWVLGAGLWFLGPRANILGYRGLGGRAEGR